MYNIKKLYFFLQFFYNFNCVNGYYWFMPTFFKLNKLASDADSENNENAQRSGNCM